MAKVYRSNIEAPGVSFDGNWEQDALEYHEKVRETCIANCSHKLAGEIVRFGVADGYAEYMVYSVRPLALLHLETLDCYQIPEAHSRGLTLSDIKKMVEWEKNLSALFREKAK